MPYAVLQTDLGTPSIEQLRRATRSVPGLTPVDASILGADAFGILVKNFSAQQAAALQGALRIEDVETEIVDQSFLPELPPVKIVHRLECLPQHLLIYDPLGRAFPIEWPHVLLIAAGSVRLTEFIRQRTERQIPVSPGEHSGQIVVDYDTKEQRSFHGIAEIVLTGAVMRFSVHAEKFNFACLGPRQTTDPLFNFRLLMQDAMQFSPNAGRNRGAEAIRIDAEQTFVYPSKNAFYEEIVWMLWQMKKTA